MNVVKAAATAETKTEAPALPPVEPVITDELETLIANRIADGIARALPRVMEAMSASLQAQNPNLGAMPSQGVNIQIGESTTTATKPTWLKHYRLDGTINGKFQMFDVKKIKSGVEIGDPSTVIKGKWIHFLNGHFYASTQQEVDMVEWMIENGNTRIYEAHDSGIITCPVVDCGMGFASEEGLKAHMKATHGV